MSQTKKSPLLITFSGIDGAGKSTQINALMALLSAGGYQVERLAFWDDVCVLRSLREEVMFKTFKGERGIGAPGSPVQRKDKNIRRWYLTLGRCFLYLLDFLNLKRVLGSWRSRGIDVLIMDRYAYDELATLALEKRAQNLYARAMLQVVPRPDVAFVLDAEPEIAHLRKPEYPVPFLKRYRDAYVKLAAMAGMHVVAPAAAEVMQERVIRQVMEVCYPPTVRSAGRAA